MSTGTLNLVLGRLPSYTRKARHLQLLRRYAQPAKLLNLLQAEFSRLRGDIVSKGRPYIYTVDTGNVCNLRCPLCPTGYQGLERPQSLMRLPAYLAVLEKIRPYAIEVILHNWGEPTLNPDILPIIRATREAGIGSTISSNLNLEHRGDAFLHELVESGLDHLTVSIDGTTQAVYETYRRKGDLEHVLHNLRELLAHRRRIGSRTPSIEWQFLVMKHNEHQMDDVRRLAREIGVDRLRFTSPGLPFDELSNTQLAADWLPQNPAYHMYHPGKIRRDGHLFDERCFYLYRAMTINPEGGVSPCCAVYHGSSDFGNLIDSPLDAVWNNAHYRSSRALFSKRHCDDPIETICGRCPLFKYERTQ
jgi:radical SAM protein with 4Fe4S-binding SPASM domain